MKVSVPFRGLLILYEMIITSYIVRTKFDSFRPLPGFANSL